MGATDYIFAGNALANSMKDGAMSYPLEGKFSDIEDTGGYRINFVASPYTNKQSLRVLSPAAVGLKNADITLPLPKDIKIDNTIQYSRGQADVSGGLLDPTVGGFFDWALEATGISSAMDVLGISAALGHRPMDERDSIFGGAEMRSHSYSWRLTPKVPGAAEVITRIVNKFQHLAYPARTMGQSYSRVVHPPVWFISVLNMAGGGDGKGSSPAGGQFMWDMGPLPSVLQNVSIQTQGAAGGAYGTRDGYPASTTLTLTFVELEPAISTGNGLASRSQIRMGKGQIEQFGVDTGKLRT